VTVADIVVVLTRCSYATAFHCNEQLNKLLAVVCSFQIDPCIYVSWHHTSHSKQRLHKISDSLAIEALRLHVQHCGNSAGTDEQVQYLSQTYRASASGMIFVVSLRQKSEMRILHRCEDASTKQGLLRVVYETANVVVSLRPSGGRGYCARNATTVPSRVANCAANLDDTVTHRKQDS